ncbi:MAG: recJ [Clostridiaceae bacterium]|jgi:single-stranded-DNA-specific exonuclease|nr:recJ [Clostridiaceae bacterium]
MQKKWTYSPKNIDTLMKNPRLTGISDTSLKILLNRGIDTVEKIENFMFNGLNSFYDTRLMKDAEIAVKIIIDSIKNKEEIVIYSDYDCDGICGGAVGVRLLKGLGAVTHVYTNNRFTQGYGMCKSGIDEILKLYSAVKLIITVDNGIVAYEGIQYAKDLGLKVIVTDHHEQGDTIPNADAVVDPKRKDDTYPFKGLCGTGVIFKLMLLLYWEMGKRIQNVYDVLDIVAVATVGDIVPIVDENRIIVKEGLKLISEEKKPLFRIFREITGVTTINSHYTLGFIYVPMINSVGRLEGNTEDIIEMLVSEDEEFIKSVIEHLKTTNEKRKEMTKDQCETAEKLLKEKGMKNIIVLYDESFHEGIVGLIAGRLKEKYNRPAIVFTKHEGGLKGSGRSIDNFHLKEVFDELKSLLLGYGGHAKAAGLSIKEENLDRFEEALNKLSEKYLKKDDFMINFNIDCVLNAQKIGVEIVDELKQLEPFGEGFPKPVLVLDNFQASQAMYMGEEKNHVKLISDKVSMIIWREAEKYRKKGEPQKVKAIGYPELNVYKNKVNLQFTVNNDNFQKA